ncbi:MAG: HAD-IA family hydrolase [Phycisphaerales bacterium JB050]
MSEHGVRVVCFDLGGVVVRIARSWAEACAAAGVEDRSGESFHAPDLLSGRRELSDAYQIGDLACEAYFERVAEQSAGLYTAEEIERVHRAWVFEPYPGVEELVERLNAIDGLITACLSNTNHSHWQDLQRADAGRWSAPAIQKLHTRLVSHELRAVKPNADIYQLAEGRFGASGDQIVFFDDLAENVEAACARGWRAFQIDHEADTAQQMTGHLARLGVL